MQHKYRNDTKKNQNTNGLFTLFNTSKKAPEKTRKRKPEKEKRQEKKLKKA